MAEFSIDKLAKSVAERAIQELKDNGVFVARWIPVSEGLPEEYQEVLICGEDIVRCAQLIGGLFECDDMDLYGSIDGTTVDGAETFEVVAWMPLPEPYKRGEGE